MNLDPTTKHEPIGAGRAAMEQRIAELEALLDAQLAALPARSPASDAFVLLTADEHASLQARVREAEEELALVKQSLARAESELAAAWARLRRRTDVLCRDCGARPGLRCLCPNRGVRR